LVLIPLADMQEVSASVETLLERIANSQANAQNKQ
jgi:hypothetical protein